MLTDSRGEGLLPHEDLPAVLLRERIKVPVNLLLKEDRVVALIPPDQFRLDLISEVSRSQEPFAGTAGLVIDLADFGPPVGLVKEFDGRQEIIQERAQGAVNSDEGLVFGGGVETGVADIVADTLQVFLFNSDRRSANSYRFSCRAWFW
jgi:hypothetical protein